MNKALRGAIPALLIPTLLLGCSDDEDIVDNVNLTASCAAGAPTISGATVYLECGTSSGPMATVNIFAQGVTEEVDAYNIVLSFSPSVFRYAGFVPSVTLFQNDCNSGATFCLDNLSVNANTSGKVVFGVALLGPNPSGEMPTTKSLIGQLLFETAGAGSTAPVFSGAASPGCVGLETTGNALLSGDASSSCLVSVLPGIDFQTNPASLILTATAS